MTCSTRSCDPCRAADECRPRWTGLESCWLSRRRTDRVNRRPEAVRRAIKRVVWSAVPQYELLWLPWSCITSVESRRKNEESSEGGQEAELELGLLCNRSIIYAVATRRQGTQQQSSLMRSKQQLGAQDEVYKRSGMIMQELLMVQRCGEGAKSAGTACSVDDGGSSSFEQDDEDL